MLPAPFRKRGVREVASVVVIATLVITAFLTGRQTDNREQVLATATDAANTNATSVDKLGPILADVCKAATSKSIKATGRTKDCQRAESGKVREIVPVVEPPSLVVQQVSTARIEQVVDAYLKTYLTDLSAQYRDTMRQEVVAYLKANPPKNGKDAPAPTPVAIATAVAAYLAANPPVAGKDGVAGVEGPAGVSVTGAALDGCDVVFYLSNDTSVRVGPICGPKGEKGDGPTAAELKAAVAAYCADQPGGTCEGGIGPAGYPTGWRAPDGSVCTDPDGDHFYTCEAPPPPTSAPPASDSPGTPLVPVPTG